MKYCEKCGTEMMDDQQFCAACGNGSQIYTESGQMNAVQKTQKRKGNVILIALAVFIPMIVVVLSLFVFSDLFLSVEDLCAKGEYQKAYERAEGDEKTAVLMENAVAVQCTFVAENLKDPSSFQLREGYCHYEESYKCIILYVSAANSYGARVSEYWFFDWDVNSDGWKFKDCVSGLEEEEVYDFYDEEERYEIMLDNIMRSLIKVWISSDTKIDDASVDRINDLFEADLLDKVELIETE